MSMAELAHGTVNESKGYLYRDREMTQLVRDYANSVVYGFEWPIDRHDVDLSKVVFAVNGHATWRHGQAGSIPQFRDHKYDDAPRAAKQYLEISKNTIEYDIRWRQTVRHELVHIYQHQNDVDTGHRQSFRNWVEPLNLAGRTTSARKYLTLNQASEYWQYPMYCINCEELRHGKHRSCRAVKLTARGRRTCGECSSPIHIMRGDRALLGHDHCINVSDVDDWMEDRGDAGVFDYARTNNGLDY